MLNEYYESANSFTYNGINSLDMGHLLLSRAPLILRAEPVIDTIEIFSEETLIVDNRVDQLTISNLTTTSAHINAALTDENTSLEEMAHKYISLVICFLIEYRKLYDTYDKDYYTLAYVNCKCLSIRYSKTAIGRNRNNFHVQGVQKSYMGDKTIFQSPQQAHYTIQKALHLHHIKIYGNGNITFYVNGKAFNF